MSSCLWPKNLSASRRSSVGQFQIRSNSFWVGRSFLRRWFHVSPTSGSSQRTSLMKSWTGMSPKTWRQTSKATQPGSSCCSSLIKLFFWSITISLFKEPSATVKDENKGFDFFSNWNTIVKTIWQTQKHHQTEDTFSTERFDNFKTFGCFFYFCNIFMKPVETCKNTFFKKTVSRFFRMQKKKKNSRQWEDFDFDASLLKSSTLSEAGLSCGSKPFEPKC